MKTLITALVLVFVVAGCGSEPDLDACRSAIENDNTPALSYYTNPSARPQACEGVDDETFGRLHTEAYDKFMKELKQDG